MLGGPRPILEVRDLRTHFFSDEGTVKAVDGASLDVYAGKTLGIVGESGCGKSVTARSILRIVERPGRIVSGSIVLRREGVRDTDLAQLDSGGREMRDIRGGDIALIFQEPMTSFSPVHTVGSQIVETIRLHQRVSKPEARARAVEMLRRGGGAPPGRPPAQERVPPALGPVPPPPGVPSTRAAPRRCGAGAPAWSPPRAAWPRAMRWPACSMTTETPTPLLEVRNLRKLFPIRKGFLRRVVGQVRAVDGVSFEVRKGETLSLVGESGCGKTTTARCILRALAPTAGEILFRTGTGEVVDVAGLPQRALRPLRRPMPMIFPDPVSPPHPPPTPLHLNARPPAAHRLGTPPEPGGPVAGPMRA